MHAPQEIVGHKMVWLPGVAGEGLRNDGLDQLKLEDWSRRRTTRCAWASFCRSSTHADLRGTFQVDLLFPDDGGSFFWLALRIDMS